MSTPQQRKDVYFTTKWKKLRKRKLQQKPLCERCEQMGLTVAAEIAHHIVPISEGGPPFPDLDGLESMCTPCHSSHHNLAKMSDERRQFFDLLKTMK